MLFDPAPFLVSMMQLTYVSPQFKLSILTLAIGGFAVAYSAEKYLFPELARWIGRLYSRMNSRQRKKRKTYKLVLEGMGV